MDAQSPSRRDALATRYGFDAWPGEGEDPVRVERFAFDDAEVPGYRRHREVSPPSRPGVRAAIESVWVRDEKPGADEAIVLVDVFETDSHEQAKEVLLDLLGQVESPSVERIEGVGNVAFSPGEGAVLFVRGNVAARVMSGGPGTGSVVDVARGLDDGLRRRSQGGSGSGPPDGVG